MNGLSILMFIFGTLIFLSGLYLYRGKRTDFTELLLWKTHNVKTMPISEIKNVGKWTMITSIIPIIIGLLVLLFEV